MEAPESLEAGALRDAKAAVFADLRPFDPHQTVHELDEHGLEAYERLLHDVMLGDQLLFTRADEVERLWACAAPVLADPPQSLPYPQGSWGPEPAAELAPPTGWGCLTMADRSPPT
jgi:glucose-6-phosphate 1-dehydrogenase